jgi:hypothetical protein
MKLLASLMLLLLTSCTYSITMVHTQGEATDVVDETATNTPSTSVSVPVSATSVPGLPSASTVVK